MSRFRTIMIAGIFGSLAIAAAPAVDKAPDLDAFLQTLDAKRSQLQDFEAAFHQAKYAAMFDEMKVSHGTLRFRQPNNMLWEYKVPDHSFLRVSGEDIRFYFPLLEQIEIYPITDKDSVSSVIDSFTAPTNRLRGEYDLAYLEPGTGSVDIGGETYAWADAPGLRLTPTTARLQAQFTQLEVWVDPDTFVPRIVVIHEPTGDRTTFALEDIAVNRGLSLVDMELPAPPNTEIIRMDAAS